MNKIYKYLCTRMVPLLEGIFIFLWIKREWCVNRRQFPLL